MIPFLFSATIFLSSALLFLAQLLFGKMILPLWGSAPQVWIVCMFFYQSLLLCGYLYAHLLSRKFSLPLQAFVHILLLLLASFFLPLEIKDTPSLHSHQNPTLSLLWSLTSAMALPFFALSANTIFLQKWHAAHLLSLPRTAMRGSPPTKVLIVIHKFLLRLWEKARISPSPLPPHQNHWCGGESSPARREEKERRLLDGSLRDVYNDETKVGGCPDRETYSLYRFSNLGSMLALVSYPFLIEPLFRLSSQSFLWTVLYLLVLVLVGCSAVTVWRNNSFSTSPQIPLPPPLQKGERGGFLVEDKNEGQRKGIWKERLRWTFLSFIPACMLLGVTSYLTTDLSPIPLLWVLPLSVYLLTFILVFGKRITTFHLFFLRSLPVILLPLLVFILAETYLSLHVMVPWHLLALFFVGIAMHGELSFSRPETDRLGEFYFCIAFGGMLGGLFQSILAPMVFNSFLEYAIILSLACFVPSKIEMPEQKTMFPKRLSLLFLTLLIIWILKLSNFFPAHLNMKLIFILTGVLCLVPTLSPKRYGIALFSFLIASFFIPAKEQEVLFKKRTFFGIHKVKKDPAKNRIFLTHGNTVHGAQNIGKNQVREPLTYYHPSGPLGEIFSRKSSRKKVATVGLGAGSMVWYGRQGENWTFYEIDPVVQEIAQDPNFFTFLRDSKATFQIVLGDARIRLAESKTNFYDLIILDAFSSDAIPIHLLTREALQLYLSKLDQDGWIVFHLSNRYLDLVPVVTNLAKDAGIEMVFKEDKRDQQEKKGIFSSTWAVLSREKKEIQKLSAVSGWKKTVQMAPLQVWSDDFSNLFSALR